MYILFGKKISYILKELDGRCHFKTKYISFTKRALYQDIGKVLILKLKY